MTTHTQTPPESAPADYGRPGSIEELSNRFVVHPLSSVVERIAIRFGISANVVSFLGLGSGLLAAWCYYYQSQLSFVIGGFLLMVAWHIFDGADGRIARATGTSSAFGRIIDGMCDHLVFGAVYFAFVFYLLKTGHSNSVWLLAIAAALSHAVQAAGYEERRQKYQRRHKGVGRDEVNAKLLDVEGGSSGLAKLYDAAQRIVSGGTSPLDGVLDNLRREGKPEAARQVIDKTGIIVKGWALLNANNRTIMIAIMALIGMPALYFIYEIVVLNIVLIALIVFERSAEKRIAAQAAS